MPYIFKTGYLIHLIFIKLGIIGSGHVRWNLNQIEANDCAMECKRLFEFPELMCNHLNGCMVNLCSLLNSTRKCPCLCHFIAQLEWRHIVF